MKRLYAAVASSAIGLLASPAALGIGIGKGGTCWGPMYLTSAALFGAIAFAIAAVAMAVTSSERARVVLAVFACSGAFAAALGATSSIGIQWAPTDTPAPFGTHLDYSTAGWLEPALYAVAAVATVAGLLLPWEIPRGPVVRTLATMPVLAFFGALGAGALQNGCI